MYNIKSLFSRPQELKYFQSINNAQKVYRAKYLFK